MRTDLVEGEEMKSKVVLTGMRTHGRMMLSGFKKEGINIKNIPAYFTIEVDISSIKIREKK